MTLNITMNEKIKHLNNRDDYEGGINEGNRVLTAILVTAATVLLGGLGIAALCILDLVLNFEMELFYPTIFLKIILGSVFIVWPLVYFGQVLFYSLFYSKEIKKGPTTQQQLQQILVDNGFKVKLIADEAYFSKKENEWMSLHRWTIEDDQLIVIFNPAQEIHKFN